MNKKETIIKVVAGVTALVAIAVGVFIFTTRGGKDEEKKETPKKETVKKEVKEDVKEEAKDLSKLTVSELKALAKEKNIKGASTMKKAELLDALK